MTLHDIGVFFFGWGVGALCWYFVLEAHRSYVHRHYKAKKAKEYLAQRCSEVTDMMNQTVQVRRGYNKFTHNRTPSIRSEINRADE